MRKIKFSKYSHEYKFGLLSLLIFLILSTLCVLTYYWTLQDQKEDKLKQLEVLGSLTYRDFEKIVHHNINSLEDLAGRIMESNGAFAKYLQSDTERIIRQNQGIKFIEFINESGIITFINPLEPNRKALNYDIKSHFRYSDWIAVSRDTLTNITPWITLTQSGKAFLVDVPIYYDEKFKGTISAGMDFKPEFDNLSSKQNLYSILIKDEKGNIFYSYNNPSPEIFESAQIFSKTLSPLSNNISGSWKFEFMFDSKDELKATSLQNKILALGIFLSFTIGLLAYFFLMAKQQYIRYKLINRKLNTLNEDLRKERIRAEDASRAKTQFLSNMSHEIRTPLSAILSISEILEGKELSSSEKEFLKLMQNSSKTLLNLVNNILHIDKIEAGKMELSRELFNPFLTLKKIVEIYAPTATMKGIELITNFDSVKNPKNVMGDLSRTEQIFTNLINNATKFTEKGKIEILYEEISLEGKLKLIFIVTDTGIGIEPSKMPQLFERFTQLDFGITKKHQGSGLGLAITKTLTEMMGGTLEVKSKLGEGSTFTVSLQFPIAEHQEEIIKTRSYRDLSYLKVLVVDDNVLNQKILVKILSKNNIEPDVSKDGDDALLKCASKHYDLIFMDVHMPGKDGFEVVKHLRKMDNTAVILGFSADVTKEAIERGIKAGMNDYLTKPIEQEALFATLNKYFS
ncbi:MULTISPECIES: response regulator [Aequorivita]|uniref:histidine kinase n=1 Tax=Aequorivita iocasae TaxID=2803865 RepID=A0ABX7DTJ6_9FLAO|nr:MULTISPECIES: response regulator [Aequorivita]QQX76099.1 response regulator [Aequorivita iocasae]UCA55559.1 response regulator [Aequorivita sp. F7]